MSFHDAIREEMELRADVRELKAARKQNWGGKRQGAGRPKLEQLDMTATQMMRLINRVNISDEQRIKILDNIRAELIQRIQAYRPGWVPPEE